jgi:hypothetical protein
VPGAALFYWRHAWPVLYFFKGAATAFAIGIALAGGADGDTGCVRRGVVPSQPRGHRFGRKTLASSLNLMVIDHQGVHRCQCPQLCAQSDAIGRGAALAPVVDGGFNVDNIDSGGVDGSIQVKVTQLSCINNQYFDMIAQKSKPAISTQLLSYKFQ